MLKKKFVGFDEKIFFVKNLEVKLSFGLYKSLRIIWMVPCKTIGINFRWFSWYFKAGRADFKSFSLGVASWCNTFIAYFMATMTFSVDSKFFSNLQRLWRCWWLKYNVGSALESSRTNVFRLELSLLSTALFRKDNDNFKGQLISKANLKFSFETKTKKKTFLYFCPSI